jgi:hypothetical protein
MLSDNISIDGMRVTVGVIVEVAVTVGSGIGVEVDDGFGVIVSVTSSCIGATCALQESVHAPIMMVNTHANAILTYHFRAIITSN